MRLQPEQPQLFYPLEEGDKPHWKVAWVNRVEIFDGIKFKKYAGFENRLSGRFYTRAGAEYFVAVMLKCIISWTGEYQILEYR